MTDKEVERLLQQATIVSTMMLALSRGFHGDYNNKHVGAVWEELLCAFVLWHRDTVSHPMTISQIAKLLGIPPSNAKRAIKALCAAGLVCTVKRRYARDVRFIRDRPHSPFFVEIRLAVLTAGRELQILFPD